MYTILLFIAFPSEPITVNVMFELEIPSAYAEVGDGFTIRFCTKGEKLIVVELIIKTHGFPVLLYAEALK